MMKSLEAAEILAREEASIWDYCDASLQVSSRMALAYTSGAEAYEVVMRISDSWGYDDEKRELAYFMRYVDSDSGIIPPEALSDDRTNLDEAYLILRMVGLFNKSLEWEIKGLTHRLTRRYL